MSETGAAPPDDGGAQLPPHTDGVGLDFDALKKGDVITVREQEALIGLPSGTPQFQLAVLALIGEIESELDRRGRDWVVRQRDYEIVILTDSEASKYIEKRDQKSYRGCKKRHRKRCNIDESNLTQEEIADHRKQILFMGNLLAAGATFAKRLGVPGPYRRVTPLLRPPTEDEGEGGEAGAPAPV